MMHVERPSRQRVREVVCPACGARQHLSCLGARGKVRESNHQERVDAFLKTNPRWNA